MRREISEHSFFAILQNVLGLKPSGNAGNALDVEPLSFFSYHKELAAKNTALLEFWKRNRLFGRPGNIIASPKPRYYRTTTKRRVFFSHQKFRLRFSHHSDASPDATMLCSELEPKEHEVIYRFLSEKINSSSFLTSAKHLNYIIIRGTYTEFCVIFNVHRLSGPIVHNLRALARSLRSLDEKIVSSFIFADPTRSEYYLDNKQSDGAWKWKNLFGPDTMMLRVNGQTYRFGPASFSQINQSMLPRLLDSVALLCAPDDRGRFIDLYCGYGLFANFIGKRFGETYAVDMDPYSIECGRDTARYTARRSGTAVRTHFRAAPITPSSLDSLLPGTGTRDETVVLDPPRQGPGNGVVAYCGGRGVRRAVHLFCAIDRAPIDLQEWVKSGYRISQVVALDMFPGTPNLELAVLLEPKRF